MISPSVHVAPLPATALFVFVPNSVTSLHVRIVSVDLQTGVALVRMSLARNLFVVFFEQAEKTSAATAGPAIPTRTRTEPAIRRVIPVIAMPSIADSTHRGRRSARLSRKSGLNRHSPERMARATLSERSIALGRRRPPQSVSIALLGVIRQAIFLATRLPGRLKNHPWMLLVGRETQPSPEPLLAGRERSTGREFLDALGESS